MTTIQYKGRITREQRQLILQGFCGGGIDAIANAAISDVHGTGAAPWLQVSFPSLSINNFERALG